MQVAVGTEGEGMLMGMEDGIGLAAGLEAAMLHAAWGKHLNPLDVVLRGHGMPFATHLDAVGKA